MGDWKAIRSGADGPLELYNLKTDPGEKENIADKHPDVVARIEDYLKAARTDSKDWPINLAGEQKPARPRERAEEPKPETKQ